MKNDMYILLFLIMLSLSTAAAKEEEEKTRKRFSTPPNSSGHENGGLLGPLSCIEDDIFCDALNSNKQPAEHLERLIDFMPVSVPKGKTIRCQSPIRQRAKDISDRVRGVHRRSDDEECLLPVNLSSMSGEEGGLSLQVSNLTTPVKIDIVEYI